MYTPTQLETIRIFGSKDLSFGCIVKSGRYAKIISHDYDDDNGKTGRHRFIDDGENIFTGVFESEYEILGHEPHLEDVFRKCIENKMGIDLSEEMEGYQLTIRKLVLKKIENYSWGREAFNIEYNPTLQLLEQSEETLQQIISLFE